MYSFKNDYSELVHEDILNLIIKYQKEQNNGYGLDKHSQKATELIKKYIKKDVDVHYLIGGTSANKIVISHILKPYEAVISVATGHINVHETGAIEATGHKVITVKGVDGKVTPKEIIEVFNVHDNEHMVFPKMVYISNTTEVGTIYTKSELQQIAKVCKEYNLYLFLDGARLGVALTADGNDLSMNDIAQLTDIFYIGGTKNGALLGEAVIICNKTINDHFRYSIKQNGGMLAKGYLTGIQFEGLFTNELYFKLAKHANESAKILKNGLSKLNVEFASNSNTNQQFITLSDKVVKELEKDYSFEIWEKLLNKTTIRLVTSWATDSKEIDIFLNRLKTLITK